MFNFLEDLHDFETFFEIKVMYTYCNFFSISSHAYMLTVLLLSEGEQLHV